MTLTDHEATDRHSLSLPRRQATARARNYTTDITPALRTASSLAGLQDSARLIIVLSPAYLERSTFGAAEWQTVWATDPTGAQRRVIPIRVAASMLKLMKRRSQRARNRCANLRCIVYGRMV
jgi:hypothetical protein